VTGVFQTSRPRVAVVMRIDATPTPIRLWGGVANYTVAADAVEPSGATYSGMGELVGLPALSLLINGVAERVSFNLSGMPANILALADTQANSVRNADVRVGVQELGPDWQPLSAMRWIWFGSCDAPSLSQTSSESGEITRTVTLSVGTSYTGRQRPTHAYVTNTDQQARSATDKAMERVVKYSAGATRKWPNY
jgi:hypothetical protein